MLSYCLVVLLILSLFCQGFDYIYVCILGLVCFLGSDYIYNWIILLPPPDHTYITLLFWHMWLCLLIIHICTFINLNQLTAFAYMNKLNASPLISYVHAYICLCMHMPHQCHVQSCFMHIYIHNSCCCHIWCWYIYTPLLSWSLIIDMRVLYMNLIAVNALPAIYGYMYEYHYCYYLTLFYIYI